MPCQHSRALLSAPHPKSPSSHAQDPDLCLLINLGPDKHGDNITDLVQPDSQSTRDPWEEPQASHHPILPLLLSLVPGHPSLAASGQAVTLGAGSLQGNKALG